MHWWEGAVIHCWNGLGFFSPLWPKFQFSVVLMSSTSHLHNFPFSIVVFDVDVY